MLKKTIIIILLLISLIFTFSYCSNSIKSSNYNKTNKTIDTNLEKILMSNVIDKSSSNPYDYTKSKEFNEIIALQEKALPHLLELLEESNNNGLREYIIAIACSEILNEPENSKTWTTGKEWYNEYVENKIND